MGPWSEKGQVAGGKTEKWVGRRFSRLYSLYLNVLGSTLRFRTEFARQGVLDRRSGRGESFLA